jgi:hypothetical protein
LLNSWQYTIFTTIISIYALFSDDMRIIFCSENYDDVFYSFASIVFAFFILEIIIFSIVIPGYLLSFFFWLDII